MLKQCPICDIWSKYATFGICTKSNILHYEWNVQWRSQVVHYLCMWQVYVARNDKQRAWNVRVNQYACSSTTWSHVKHGSDWVGLLLILSLLLRQHKLSNTLLLLLWLYLSCVSNFNMLCAALDRLWHHQPNNGRGAQRGGLKRSSSRLAKSEDEACTGAASQQ